jgi:hypothetical protein
MKLELESTDLSTAVMDAISLGKQLERNRIIALIATIKDNWRKPPALHYPNELFKIMNLISDTADRAEAVRSAELYFGAKAERLRIIKQIERQLCFDALADSEGRCRNHSGKCYELRQLITSLEGEASA